MSPQRHSVRRGRCYSKLLQRLTLRRAYISFSKFSARPASLRCVFAVKSIFQSTPLRAALLFFRMVRCALPDSAQPLNICVVHHWRSAQPVSIIDILRANVQRLTTLCISGCERSITADPERAILQPSLPGATTNRVHQPAPRRSPERSPVRFWRGSLHRD